VDHVGNKFVAFGIIKLALLLSNQLIAPTNLAIPTLYGIPQSSLEDSSNSPTLNPQAYQNTCQNPTEEVFDLAFEEFPALSDEEFTPERENLIRERCANSPLQSALSKYCLDKSKNIKQEND